MPRYSLLLAAGPHLHNLFLGGNQKEGHINITAHGHRKTRKKTSLQNSVSSTDR